MGDLSTKINGTWNNQENIYVKVNGSWMPYDKVYVKVNGSWQMAVEAFNKGNIDVFNLGYAPIIHGYGEKDGLIYLLGYANNQTTVLSSYVFNTNTQTTTLLATLSYNVFTIYSSTYNSTGIHIPSRSSSNNTNLQITSYNFNTGTYITLIKQRPTDVTNDPSASINFSISTGTNAFYGAIPASYNSLNTQGITRFNTYDPNSAFTVVDSFSFNGSSFTYGFFGYFSENELIFYRVIQSTNETTGYYIFNILTNTKSVVSSTPIFKPDGRLTAHFINNYIDKESYLISVDRDLGSNSLRYPKIKIKDGTFNEIPTIDRGDWDVLLPSDTPTVGIFQYASYFTYNGYIFSLKNNYLSNSPNYNGQMIRWPV